VGEIHDEYDEVLKDVESISEDAFVVNARMAVTDFNEQFGASIPPSADYETLGGFLQKHTGRIPDLNEEILHENLSLTVIKKSQRRVKMLKVKRLHPAPTHGDV
jgi:CBS domain containing-hemolysin-like protein